MTTTTPNPLRVEVGPEALADKYDVPALRFFVVWREKQLVEAIFADQPKAMIQHKRSLLAAANLALILKGAAA